MLNWFKKKLQNTVPAESETETAFSQTTPPSSIPINTPQEADPQTENKALPETAKELSLTSSASQEKLITSNLPQPESEPDNTSTEKTVSPKSTLFSRLSERLDKTKENFTYQLDTILLGRKDIDANLLDELEELLVTADVGVGTTEELLETIRRRVKRSELTDPKKLKEFLQQEIKRYIVASEKDATLVMPKKGPFVIMVIGVNGVGKTTTIGKIAHKFLESGQSVMLAAGDTFRAAAVSQLKIWGERNGITVIAHREGADPSSVVFDALSSAMAKDVDVLLVDTAGRMHTKDNLMEELKKIKRVMAKKLPAAPHETLLVLDATTGQNAISQARLFDDAVGVTGLTLTKLDGTSKGGIVINICRELKVPIRFIGVGEQIKDLRDFDAEEFTAALFAEKK